jgi:hypothetical protein
MTSRSTYLGRLLREMKRGMLQHIPDSLRQIPESRREKAIVSKSNQTPKKLGPPVIRNKDHKTWIMLLPWKKILSLYCKKVYCKYCVNNCIAQCNKRVYNL